MKSTIRSALILLAAVSTSYTSSIRATRRAIPQELYRDNVEPSKGGKVPEAAHMRIELNKLDAAGLDSGEGIRMMQHLIDTSPGLPEKTGSSYNPGRKSYPQNSFFSGSDFSSNFPFNPDFDSLKTGGSPTSSNTPFDSQYNSLFDDPFSSDADYDYSPGYSPPLKLKPGYSPEPTYSPEPSYGPSPSYAPEPAYNPYAPEPTYAPAGYKPNSYNPEPAYSAPVGPVLLEKRPYEVKSVQELPISVSKAYTGFDCRAVPYPDRHYADPEAGCQIYHFCHADGKQDTFECGYGTVFNEYLGTCDYKNNVHCGEHAVAPHHAPAHAPHKQSAPYHEPASYHEPAPYQKPASYHEPAPYQASNPYNDFGPFGYNK